MTSSNSPLGPKQLQYAYGEWVESLVCNGYTAYFMTFMFNEMGNMQRHTMAEQMLKDIETYYGRLITHFTRKPHRTEEMHMRPIMIASPDLPVPKRAKGELRDAVVNDGLHCHAICLTPPVSRFKGKFEDWAQGRQTFMIGGTSMQRLDVVLISETPAKATQYALKSLGKRMSLDLMLILPKEHGSTRQRATDRGYDEACKTVGGASLLRTRRFGDARA